MVDPNFQELIAGIFATGVFVSGVFWGNRKITSGTFTGEEYEKLRIGMSLIEAETKLGAGTEISRSQTTVKVVWRDRNNSKIIVIFEDNKLKQKEKSGLK